MAQTNLKNPTIVIPNTLPGVDWQNPNNILYPDDQFATASGSTQILTVGYVGAINIPVGASIDNIVVAVKGYRGAYDTTLQIYALDITGPTPVAYLMLPTFQGFDGVNTLWTLPATLFGTTWSVDAINNFALQLVADGELHLDTIEVNVVYTPVVPAPTTFTLDYGSLVNGPFQVGETITGSMSGATGIIASDDGVSILTLSNVIGDFIVGETITGGISGASAVVIDPTGLFVCDEFVEALPFQLAQSMTSASISCLVNSFNYPNGDPIFIADFHGDAIIVIEQGVPGKEEPCRIVGIEHNFNGSGLVLLNFGTLANRGLGYKYPYTSVPGLITDHSGTAEVVISNPAVFYNRFIKKCQADALFSVPIEIDWEGVPVTTSLHLMDFVGDGVDITLTAFHKVRVNIHDHFVGASNIDTTPGYLSDKLIAGTNINFAYSGAGNQTLTISAAGIAGAGTVYVDGLDTTPGYLDPKINIHSSDSSITVTKTITNPAGNEILDYDLITSGSSNIEVLNNGSSLGNFTKLNFKPGTSASDAGGGQADIVSSGGGSGSGVIKPKTFDTSYLGNAQTVNSYSDEEMYISKLSANFINLDLVGIPKQERDFSFDDPLASDMEGYVNLNGFFYVCLSTTTPGNIVLRFASNNLAGGGTLMTISGQSLAQTGGPIRMTSDGTNFYFNYKAGNSANAYIISKYTLSGTTLTYDSDITLDDVTDPTIGFAVLANGHIFTQRSGIVTEYNATGTTITSKSNYNNILANLFYNWGDILYVPAVDINGFDRLEWTGMTNFGGGIYNPSSLLSAGEQTLFGNFGLKANQIADFGGKLIINEAVPAGTGSPSFSQYGTDINTGAIINDSLSISFATGGGEVTDSTSISISEDAQTLYALVLSSGGFGTLRARLRAYDTSFTLLYTCDSSLISGILPIVNTGAFFVKNGHVVIAADFIRTNGTDDGFWTDFEINIGGSSLDNPNITDLKFHNGSPSATTSAYNYALYRFGHAYMRDSYGGGNDINSYQNQVFRFTYDETTFAFVQIDSTSMPITDWTNGSRPAGGSVLTYHGAFEVPSATTMGWWRNISTEIDFPGSPGVSTFMSGGIYNEYTF